jgi:ElaA protein
MNEINWQIKHFDDLTKIAFHDMIQLREKVFVVEQDCPYLDVDGEDVNAYHVLGFLNEKVVATARIFPPNEKNQVIIGRICNDDSTRGMGVGRKLVAECLAFCKAEWSEAVIKISAQCYLIKFYESFGFKVIGEEYLEDDIPHISMIIE